jgi:hypothetical protein
MDLRFAHSSTELTLHCEPVLRRALTRMGRLAKLTTDELSSATLVVSQDVDVAVPVKAHAAVKERLAGRPR